MEKTFDVIGVEDLIMDFALQIARIPKTDGMALIEDSCWAGGGNASSAIVALARLGARCAMVGTTGNDAYGAFCRADMEKTAWMSRTSNRWRGRRPSVSVWRSGKPRGEVFWEGPV